MELVTRANGRLELAGRPFRSLLVNAYYLQEEAARGRLDLVDETLAACVRLGARVVRAWGFNDDPAKLDTGMQRGRLAYAEAGLAGIDRLLERARAHGVRLVLPLVNHWNAYGGARQWLLWNGVADAREGDVRFFTDGRVREHYALHVERLLARVNPLTGLRWGEDAAVLAWELMNEPRGRGLPEDGTGSLADWVAFAAACVKRHARQLVAVGDEGEEAAPDGYDARFWRRVGGAHLFSPASGNSFSRFVACPDVDLGSCHFYPQKYGIRRGAEAEAGAAWIAEHARLSARAGKPLLVGELGLASRRADGAPEPLPERERLLVYRAWLAEAARAPVAAFGPWLFAYRARPAAWDEFTFYDDDPLCAELSLAALRLQSNVSV